MGCVDVPGVFVFYSIQSLRGPPDFEDIDASTTGHHKEFLRPPSERYLQERGIQQVTKFERAPLSRQTKSMFWRAAELNKL